MKKIRKGVGCACLAALVMGLAGCGDKNPLDPGDPVSLTVWHYYNGSQQVAFDALVEEFNETVGREKGIFVQSYSQGSVSDLESAVRDSIGGKVGADAMPDIFSSYADTAYEVEQAGALANLSDYLSEEDLERYVDSYIQEGCIASDGSLRIFPTAKSTEIMMLNKTDWEPFAAATGASLEDLKTMEGVVATAQTYYEWTDAQTPDVPGDGRAFYGRDAMANYFIIGMQQLGVEIFQVENGKLTLNVPKEELKRLWENYYIPMIKGYFGAYGSFRSDDVKTGDLLAYTGSTSSAMYFPNQVELEQSSYPIEYVVMTAPVFQDGRPYAVQQGAGMVVTKGNDAKVYACVEFLKWFTADERNIEFSVNSGYLPVTKTANHINAIEDSGVMINDDVKKMLSVAVDTVNENQMYTTRAFETGNKARNILEYSLSDRAAADREEVAGKMASGMSLSEAAEDFISDASFEAWYEETLEQLKALEG